MIEFTATAEDDGERLDIALARRPQVGSRAAAQRLIDAGLVSVDGAARAKGHRLREGERVEARPEPLEPDTGDAAGQAPFEVVYEDDDLMVVDKPAGVVVHPAAGHATGTLSQALAARGAAGGDPWRPGIVHRLDRDTSGLLIVAKSEEVHRLLQQMIQRREIERMYQALVEGRPDARSGTIDAAIGRGRRDRTRHSVATDRPREAVTHFELADALPRTSLLRVRLETGRTHQIRVHLAAIGHPVCGDSQYGGGPCGERLGLARQFLHSSQLRFRQPRVGNTVLCESKLPVDLRRALDAAAREPASEGPDGG
jgi:23S rRNA pseudouridine1911/1915/1917 synthase